MNEMKIVIMMKQKRKEKERISRHVISQEQKSVGPTSVGNNPW